MRSLAKSDADQRNRLAAGAVGLGVASGSDLAERDLSAAHLEFDDVDFVGQFQHGVDASLGDDLFGVHFEAKQTEKRKLSSRRLSKNWMPIGSFLYWSKIS
ncbi:MAG TPA: hypothetical protein PL105_24955 [Caldilineaceae bacterium]|nr:hypothetical protein [Caldilineaceae bacterium]